ncbi:MAG: ArnT family glycosyltransferase [Thermodesulfobacteriota bacterium]
MDYKRSAIIFIAALAVFRIFYIYLTPFDLSPDEAHYWEWSRRLDWSYYSKGPLVAYVIAFFTKLLGATDLGVRFGSVVFSALASYGIFLAGRMLFDDPRVGFYSAVVANVTPIFAIGSILMTTDVLLVFFWVYTVVCVKKALDDGGRFTRRGGRWWYAAGLLVGAGFLGKYTMVLLWPCLLLFVFFSPRDRFWLARTEPYVGALASLVVASPVLIWNYANGWVTFRHTMGQTHLADAAFSLAGAAEFVGSQAGILTPLVFAGVVYGAARAAGAGLRRRESGPLLAFFTSAPVFALFLLKGLHGKVQANWAIAAYVTAFPAAVWAFSEAYRRAVRPSGRRLLAGLAVAAILMGGVMSFLAYFPWLVERAGVEGVLDGPPFNRVTGWADLGAKVSALKEDMDKSGQTFIISDTYQISSELAFYVEGNPVTYNVPTAARRMNQYDLWPGFEGLKGGSALYVRGGDVELDAAVEEAFDRCEKVLERLYMGSRYLKDFSVFKCYGFKGMRGPEDARTRY